MSEAVTYSSMIDPAEDQNSAWIPATFFTLAATAVGYAIQLRDGEYNYPGMSLILAVHWVGIAIIFTFIGAAISSVRPISRGPQIALSVLAISSGFEFLELLTSPPSGGNWWSNDLRPGCVRAIYDLGLTIATAAGALLLVDRKRVRRIIFPAILIVHFFLGVWMVRNAPDPKIDVFEFQQQSAATILHGQNPYRLTFADIYHGTDQANRPVYGQNLTRDGRLGFGFPYPPLSLFLALPGYLLAGDHRYSQALAMTLAGAFIGYARFSRMGVLAAVLFLFTPRTFFILGRGWTEPFVVCLVALTVLCACRGWTRWAMPIAAGLLMASKQYLVIGLPIFVLLVPGAAAARVKQTIVTLSKILLTAAIVTLPLACWDRAAFVHSTWNVQQVAPFRDDALSYLVWTKQHFGIEPGVAPAFFAAMMAMIFAIARLPRRPWAFAAGLAFVFLPFIALNKQAFANYYYFAIGCLCAAVAAIAGPSLPLRSPDA